MRLDELPNGGLNISRKLVQCQKCKYLKPLQDTDFSDPMWPLTFECTSPDHPNVRMSDIQKIHPHECEKYEPLE